MKKIITEKISKDEIVKKVREVREKEGRLVAINGYVNKEKSNIIVYTLEYDEFRKHYHIEGENILPTITNIYKGAQWFEEEIQEVMPVKFEGLVFSGRLFLPDEFKKQSKGGVNNELCFTIRTLSSCFRGTCSC